MGAPRPVGNRKGGHCSRVRSTSCYTVPRPETSKSTKVRLFVPPALYTLKWKAPVMNCKVESCFCCRWLLINPIIFGDKHCWLALHVKSTTNRFSFLDWVPKLKWAKNWVGQIWNGWRFLQVYKRFTHHWSKLLVPHFHLSKCSMQPQLLW